MVMEIFIGVGIVVVLAGLVIGYRKISSAIRACKALHSAISSD